MEKEEGATGIPGARIAADGDANVSRLAQLEGAEQKQKTDKIKRLAEARNLADVEELLDYANVVKRLELPTLTDDEGQSYYVEYCPLRICDLVQIRAVDHEDEDIRRDLQNREMVYYLLNRADPETWTREKVENLPASWINTILIEYGMQEEDRFLLSAMRRKADGLRQTRQRGHTSS